MATSDHSVKINALDHEIGKVAVYDDRAAVTRRFQINFEVCIEFSVVISCTIEQMCVIVILGRKKRGCLPKVLESDSIRVETETTSPSQVLTVFDVIFIPPQSEYKFPQSDPFSKLEDRRVTLEN